MMRRSLATGLLLAALAPEATHAQRPQDPERDTVRAVITRFAEHVQAVIWARSIRCFRSGACTS